MNEKGRQAKGERQGTHTRPESRARGERHGSVTHPESRQKGSRNRLSKLTEEQVIAIRTAYRGRGRGPSQQDLADLYGVRVDTIGRVTRGEEWTHIGLDLTVRDGRRGRYKHGRWDAALAALRQRPEWSKITNAGGQNEV